MAKILKHLALFKELKVPADCPGKDGQVYEVEVFRWYRSDWDSQTNFLPNALEPRPRRTNLLDIEKCGYCGMSFYNDQTAAENKFNGYSKNTKEKLGHTHVYKGVLDSMDGLGSPLKNNHFNFYDYQGIELHLKFIESCTLSAS